LPGFGKKKLDITPDYENTAIAIAMFLYTIDDVSVRDRMYAIAKDPKHDRGVRQVAIGYLVYKADPRAKELEGSDVLTAAQREEAKRLPFSHSLAEAAAPTQEVSTPRRRKHHRF
jgi:hypothetical protein